MKNGGFSVIATIALLVCALGTITATATGDKRNRVTTQTCECSTVAGNTQRMTGNTKTSAENYV